MSKKCFYIGWGGVAVATFIIFWMLYVGYYAGWHLLQPETPGHYLSYILLGSSYFGALFIMIKGGKQNDNT